MKISKIIGKMFPDLFDFSAFRLGNSPCHDIRNQCFMWAIIMLAGALLSCFLTPYIAIPTYIIWLVLFFREVHFDNHKAFEKYLLK